MADVLTPFEIALAVRLPLVALVVVTASLAVERVNPIVGAMVATLPLSTGPAYVFLAMDHGPVFIAQSTVASLLSVAAVCMFLLVHVWTAPRTGTALCLAASLSAWALSLVVLTRRNWSMPEALALLLGCQVAGAWLTRRARAMRIPIAGRPRAWHLVVRAAAVMFVVAAATIIGRWFGPAAAGAAALVPIVFTSLIGILQPRIGGTAMASVMANSLVGMIGYAFALTLLNLTAVPLGAAASLGLALATCVAWNALVIAWTAVSRRRPA